MKTVILALLSFSLFVMPGLSQPDTGAMVNRFFKEALTHQLAYENLRGLTWKCPGRISGTPAAAAAVEYTRQLLEALKPDTVWLQEVEVPHWIRGRQEKGMILSAKYGQMTVPVTALGTTPGTGPEGISAPVIEVKSLDEVRELGKTKIEGKIVFFNRPMDPVLFNTFAAYGGAADQRTRGPALAAHYGAVAAVIRSLTTRQDDIPHTGVSHFDVMEKKIPAVAVSTLGAGKLHRILRNDPDTRFYMFTGCRNAAPVKSFNVVGEIRGTTFPEQIITVGGHLDAWDTGEGAHDDGAGCVQAIEMIRIFRELGIRPKHTIRAVMFMDEEIAQSGGKVYAAEALRKGEKHVLALESDRGGFLPLGFGIGTSDPELFSQFMSLKPYFSPWGINEFTRGGGGTDIGPLRQQGTILISLVPDSQRYFDVHHSGADVFEAVNPRELELGAAAITSLIWLADQMNFSRQTK